MDSDWKEKGHQIVMVEWRGENYLGHIKRIVPEFSDEIVFLKKSFYPRGDFEEAVKETGDIEQLYADETLNLDGRYHVLRQRDRELSLLSDEQKDYMNRDNNMSRVYELMIDDEVLGSF